MKGINRTALLLVSLMIVGTVPLMFFSEARENYFGSILAGDEFADRKVLAAIIILGLFSSDIFLPVPASAVCAAAGKLFGFAGGTLLCWAGLNISSLIGYGLGYLFGWTAVRKFSSETDVLELKQQVELWGVWPLVAFRPLPVLAEASILFLGMYRFPIKIFVAPVLLANLVVSGTFVAIGYWFAKRDLFAVGVLISVAIPVIALACWTFVYRKTDKTETRR